MKDYIRNTEGCRRKLLLKEFGFVPDVLNPLHNCCNIFEKVCQCGSDCRVNELKFMNFDLVTRAECCKKHCRLSEEGQVILRKKFVEMRDSLLADTVQGYCGVEIASGFPLSAVDMITENASELFTKIELKYYTCLFREDIMD